SDQTGVGSPPPTRRGGRVGRVGAPVSRGGACDLSRGRGIQWGAVTARIEAQRARLSDGVVSTAPDDLAAHAHDWWTLALLRERRGDDVPRPAAVVRPRTAADVSAVLRWATETRTPVVPFGGGSGVSGGAEAVPGAVAIDMRAMDRVIEIDERALTVTVQAGVMGYALEDALAHKGYTLGHFPQSIDI